MKVVYYKKDAPWVGSFNCPDCSTSVAAWKSSGMSESCPHFYCNKCSNALVREKDKKLLYELGATEELLNTILPTLPLCGCGGKFEANSNPKCPKCKSEFKHQGNAVNRLSDPHVILVDGASLYRDRLYSYKISIGSKLKYWLRVLVSPLTKPSI
jgi:transposase-like protein